MTRKLKTTNKESKTITSNAGCGVSVQRNPKNKTYKYTLTAKVSPYLEKMLILLQIKH